MTTLPTLDNINANGKTVLVRADLNVPMEGGRVADASRIRRLLPTLQELTRANARVVVLSHFGRPEGTFVPSMSLAPLVDTLAEALGNTEVKFGVDCVGPAAREAVSKIPHGGIILLENLRFHAEEEKNDAAFARDLASLGEIYVNDAFSCSHRVHASVVGITEHLPSVAGRLMQQEVEILSSIFSDAGKPITAIIGGAKVSTKLALLENLVDRVDNLIIGGAMANTFLLAQGHSVGKSLVEEKLQTTAKHILKEAKKKNCNVILPIDVIVKPLPTKSLIEAGTSTATVNNISFNEMVYDIGNQTLRKISDCLRNPERTKTVIWNGPMGLFETRPYDMATIYVAREIASLTREKKTQSIAGGGDTLSAIAQSGLSEEFTYLSTAGGAFLEWLEGKELPGIAALTRKNADSKSKVKLSV